MIAIKRKFVLKSIAKAVELGKIQIFIYHTYVHKHLRTCWWMPTAAVQLLLLLAITLAMLPLVLHARSPADDYVVVTSLCRLA